MIRADRIASLACGSAEKTGPIGVPRDRACVADRRLVADLSLAAASPAGPATCGAARTAKATRRRRMAVQVADGTIDHATPRQPQPRRSRRRQPRNAAASPPSTSDDRALRLNSPVRAYQRYTAVRTSIRRSIRRRPAIPGPACFSLPSSTLLAALARFGSDPARGRTNAHVGIAAEPRVPPPTLPPDPPPGDRRADDATPQGEERASNGRTCAGKRVQEHRRRRPAMAPTRRSPGRPCRKARSLFPEKKYKEAAAKFATAADRWPDTPLEEDALFLQGESEFFFRPVSQGPRHVRRSC